MLKHLLKDTVWYYKKSGIYRIRNTQNDKCYIGSAVNLYHRQTVHFKFLRRNNHHSILLQRAFNKYGESFFSFEVLEECPKESLISREQFYIDLYNPKYNVQKVAGSSLGRPCSEETKKKISERTKGRVMSEETRQKISRFRKGKKTPLETILKIQESRKGYVHSDSTRRKIGIASKNRKPDSPETTLKKSLATTLRNKKPILQFNKNGDFICEWPSTKECEKALGITNVIRMLKNGYVSRKGFSFKYK